MMSEPNKSSFARLAHKVARVRGLLRERIHTPPKVADEIVTSFHRLYYNQWHHLGKDTLNASWQGVRTLKCPLDLWVYQELLAEVRPDLVVETGTRAGGSALFLSQMLDLMGGEGRVISIDVELDDNRPQHARLSYLVGSSTAPDIADQVRKAAGQASRVMVFLDSDHSASHVTAELAIYADLVTSGSYLVVEDTNVNGHPVYDDHGPGPAEAVTAFLAQDTRFEIDPSRERFLLTMNPGGYLRRVA